MLLRIADHHPKESVDHQALGAMGRQALGMKKLGSNPSSVFGPVCVASWTSGFSSVKSEQLVPLLRDVVGIKLDDD